MDIVHKNGFIDPTVLKNICEYIQQKIPKHLLEESRKEYKYPDTILQDSITIKTVKKKDIKKKVRRIDMNKWHDLKDNEFVKGTGENDIDTAIKNYLLMLNWVSTYYFNGVVDWRVEPTFTTGPTIMSLIDHMKDIHYHPRVSNPPLIPSVMLAVLPKASENLIPRSLRPYILSSGVSDETTIVREGTDIDWGGLTIVKPQLTGKVLSSLDNIVSEMRKKLPIEWLFKRTIMLKFSYDEKLNYIFSNMYGKIQDCHVRTEKCPIYKKHQE